MSHMLIFIYNRLPENEKGSLSREPLLKDLPLPFLQLQRMRGGVSSPRYCPSEGRDQTVKP